MPFDWDDIDADVNPALLRAVEYNSSAYNASTNPYGLGSGGHINIFPMSMDDVAIVANAFPAFADLMSGYADDAETSNVAAAAQAAKLRATSTTSVALSTAEKTFTTQASKQIAVGDTLLITSDANPTTHWVVIRVTSYSSTTLVGDVLMFAGSGSRADWTIRHSGIPGCLAGLVYKFSTSTSNADPTTGTLAINHGTPASATALYMSETDFFGTDISAVLARWGVSTSTIRGRITIVSPSEPTKRLEAEIMSARTDNGTWDTFTIQNCTGTLPTNGGLIVLSFTHTGDKGLTGDTGAAGGTGTTGETGQDGGIKLSVNTATSGDPGSGKFLFNHATFASATAWHVSETDGNSNTIGPLLAALDNGSGTNKIFVFATKQGGAAYYSFMVTAALSDQGAYDTFAITPITTSGSISNNDVFHVVMVPLEKGDTGAGGAAGSTGAAGPTTAPTWLFDAGTSDADPGSNEFALNHGTISSVNKAFISDVGVASADMTSFLAALDDSTNTTNRGTLFIVQANDPTKYAIFTVGVSTDDGAYFDLALTYVTGPGGFTAGQACALAFFRSGNAGAGTGDVVGPASSTNNGIPLFDGTDGKLLKNSGAAGALAYLAAVDTAQITDAANTNAKLANMVQGTVKGRAAGAGTGAPTDRTDAQLKTDMAFVKGDVGLGNVDNTSDANKPVSTAQAAINDIKRAVSARAATTANITIATALNNGDSLDGVTLATGDLVLVKDQTSPAENGVYVVAVSPARHTELDAFNDNPGLYVTVQEGSAGADTTWLCTSDKGGTIDSTALTFVKQGGPTATLLARANHTGTQAASTISDFTEAAQDVIGALLVDSTDIDFTYNDGGDAETVALTTAAKPYGKQAVPIPASAMFPAASGGPATGNAITVSNTVQLQSLDFDGSSAETAYFGMRMPASWNEGTITFQPVFSQLTTVAGAVVFELAAVAASDGDTFDTAYGTGQTSTKTAGTINVCYIGPESSAITVAGTPAAGDFVHFRLKRLPADAGDTLAQDARLEGITLFITTDAGHD